MPLLPPEPYLFPETLLTEGTHAPQEGHRWWVLHTRPRAEKALVRRILAQGDSFFLPLYYRRWRTGGRLRSSYLPLFPGYVFLHGTEDERLRALETNLVANVIPVLDQDGLSADLARVYRLMALDVPLSPEACLPPGTPVSIISGPLAGLEGKVIRQGKQCKFLVEVRLLNQGVSVEVESWMFQPAARPAEAYRQMARA
jgi:transcriptional antiterminator RfaH